MLFEKMPKLPTFTLHHTFWCVSLNNSGVSSSATLSLIRGSTFLCCFVLYLGQSVSVKRLTPIKCCTKNHLLLPFVFLCAIFVFPRTIHVFPSAIHVFPSAILVFPRAANFAAMFLQPQPPLTSCANLVHSTHDEDGDDDYNDDEDKFDDNDATA